MVSQVYDLIGLLRVRLAQELYLTLELVAKLLVSRDIIDGVGQDGELLLEELDAVICDLLLHVQVE